MTFPCVELRVRSGMSSGRKGSQVCISISAAIPMRGIRIKYLDLVEDRVSEHEIFVLKNNKRLLRLCFDLRCLFGRHFGDRVCVV